MTNIAEISGFATDTDGTPTQFTEDWDSDVDNLNYPESVDDLASYEDSEISDTATYIPGQQDDDDFEKVYVKTNGEYKLVLEKQDDSGNAITGTDLGAKFSIQIDSQDATIYTTSESTGKVSIPGDTDKDGTEESFEINKYNVGTKDKYTIKETEAPSSNYSKFGGTIEIIVSKTYDTTNKKYKISPTDCTVTVKDANGETITPIEETKEDNSKTIITDDVSVSIKDNGEIYVTVKDYEIRSIKIKKVGAGSDTDKLEPLNGVEFRLYKFIGDETENSTQLEQIIDVSQEDEEYWEEVGTYTTDSYSGDGSGSTSVDGIIELDNLKTKYTYRLIETKAAAGMVTPSGQWNFKFVDEESDNASSLGDDTFIEITEVTKTDAGTTVSAPPAFKVVNDATLGLVLQLENRAYYILPTSGSFGTESFYKIGGIIMFLGLLILFFRKRVYIVKK